MVGGMAAVQGGWPHGAGWRAGEDEEGEAGLSRALAAPVHAPPSDTAASAPATLASLYIADPLIAELMATLGGQAAPATSSIAQAQVQAVGADRYAQLCRLSQALHAVRETYSAALGQAARQPGGPGWVTPVVRYSDHNLDAEPMAPSAEPAFDPDAFTAWFIAQDGLANRAFAQMFGRSHTTYEVDGRDQRVLSEVTFDNASWSCTSLGGPLIHRALTAIDLNHPPELIDPAAVGFDPEVGWATAAGNVQRQGDWLDGVQRVAELAMVGTVAYLSAGTLGPAAAASMGLSAGSAAGAAVSAAAVGAATSLAGGFASGNVSVQGVLRGAVSGALSAGLTAGVGQADALAGLGDVGTVALRGGVQGAVQGLMGGSFREGAVAGVASGVAEVAVGHAEAGIAEAVEDGTLEGDQVIQARMAARVMGSAVRAAAAPEGQGRAFAEGVLNEWVGAGLEAAQASSQRIGRSGASDDEVLTSHLVRPEPAPLVLDRGQEERLQAGLTVTDFGDATGVAGDVTAAAGVTTGRPGEVLTVKVVGRTAYLNLAPAPAEPPPPPRRLEDPVVAFQREQAALDRVLQEAAAAEAAGVLGATGDPSWMDGDGLVVGPGLQPREAVPVDGQIVPLSRGDAFFTFNPVGRFAAHFGEGLKATILSPVVLAQETALAVGDAWGAARATGAGWLTGHDERYDYQGQLARTLAKEGLLGTFGLGVTGFVRGAAAPLNALYRNDLDELGRSLPGALLAAGPLAWGSRVSGAAGLTVEELAIVERGNPVRMRILDAVAELARPTIEAIQRLDPDAPVGIRGSLTTGMKNPNKLGQDLKRVPYDGDVEFIRDPGSGQLTRYEGPQGFDLDIFVVSDSLASRFPRRDWFRNLARTDFGPRVEIEQLSEMLNSNSLLHRVKQEPLSVRVFTTRQLESKLASGDHPIRLDK